MKSRFEPLFWVIAAALGLGSGYVHLVTSDPTLVALLALASAMFLGFVQPHRPWLWAVILASAIPLADLYARVTGQPIYRGRIEGAFIAGLVSGLVGAYAGAVGNRTVRRVFSKDPQA